MPYEGMMVTSNSTCYNDVSLRSFDHSLCEFCCETHENQHDRLIAPEPRYVRLTRRGRFNLT